MDDNVLNGSWANLARKAAGAREGNLADLFSAEASRFEQYHCETPGLLLDYSKQPVDSDILTLLEQLAVDLGLPSKIQDLLQGSFFNPTEQRFVRHTALRSCHLLDDEDISHAVGASLSAMADMVCQLRSGAWLGATGLPVTDVVNLGVGGSDLGAKLAVQALYERSSQRSAVSSQHGEDKNVSKINVHFVSSMDGSHLLSLLPALNPETTLFIVASKSFGTIDTFANLETARAWMEQSISHEDQLAHHLIGVSANPDKMTNYGIPKPHQLVFWEWVGGRFSVWSAIGLPLAIAVGMNKFTEFLNGASAMDEHFGSAPLLENIPVLMGLLGVWNRNFMGINNHACLPYDGCLTYLPHYLQQLEMESNGKSACLEGKQVVVDTNPLVWGGLGTDGQHAFFQWLHQGCDRVTADFITVAPPVSDDADPPLWKAIVYQKQLAYANCLSQSRLLAFGNKVTRVDDVADVRFSYTGNTASSTLLLKDITAFNLGVLLAAYEHKVFVQSVIWNVNAFDQPGVELGKLIAKSTLEAMESGAVGDEWDASTAGLLKAAFGENLKNIVKTDENMDIQKNIWAVTDA